MPALVLDALVIAAVITLFWARTEVALGLLLVAVFVVPAPMRVPHTHSSYITVLHVLVLAAVVRLVVHWADGRMQRHAFALTPVHLAWIVFVLAAFAVGVMFVATPGGLANAGQRLADLLTQVAFFVVVLALIRKLPDLRAGANVAAVAVLVSTVIALVEHVTGNAWGHWLFAWDPSATPLDAEHPLDVRQGQVRVRAGAEFALQYGWMVATMIPVVLVAALRTRRWRYAVPVAAAMSVLAVYWSFSRSALAAVAAVVLLLALLAREVRATWLALVAMGAGALAVAVHPSLLSHLSTQIDPGSVSVRFERIAPILHSVAQHPFRGLGLGNLIGSGFRTTDNAFLLQYTELGAIGVAILAVLLLAALGQSAWSLAAHTDDDRLLGAACTTGVVAYIAGAVFYDAFSLLQGALLLWFLVAFATVVAERAGHAPALVLPSPRPLAVTATVAAGVGFAVFFAAPEHIGVDSVFTAMSPVQQSGADDPVSTGNVLAATVCAAADFRQPTGATVTCTADPDATAYGNLRFEAQSRAGVVAAQASFAQTVRDRLGITSLRVYPIDPPRSGRTAVWATAPAWIPIGLVGVVVLAPWRRRRLTGA